MPDVPLDSWVRVATRLAKEREELLRALEPFAGMGMQLQAERGPALSLNGAHPVRISYLVDAAKAFPK